jgi:hydrogenase maturation factor
MCLAFLKRDKARDSVAIVDFWGAQGSAMDIVDENVVPGDYILNHVGCHPAHRGVIAETLALTKCFWRRRGTI